MNNNNKSLSAAGDQPASAEQGSKGVLKLGLDMHYRQVTVAMQEDCGPLKAVGKLSHDGFWGWVQKKQKEGWEVYSCYEAGASGYWLHRDLVGIGIKNQVVAPKATGQDKRQKTWAVMYNPPRPVKSERGLSLVAPIINNTLIFAAKYS